MYPTAIAQTMWKVNLLRDSWTIIFAAVAQFGRA